MKEFTTMIVSGALALSMVLAGCAQGGAGAQSQDSAEEQTQEAEVQEKGTSEEGEAAQGDSLIVGGWQVQEDAASLLNKDQQALFDEALKNLVGVRYEPIAELATQVVAGSNHVFLCRGATATAEPKVGWYMVVVYQDPQGVATVGTIQELDITNLQTSDEALPSDLVGGWTVVEPQEATLAPKEADAAFKKATEGWVGVSLSPVATLATQVVNGTNYLVLCNGQTATADPVRSLYVATVYQDTKGNVEMSSVEQLNLLNYVHGA